MAEEKARKAPSGGPGGGPTAVDLSSLEKNPVDVMKRVIAYVLKNYKGSVLIVIICIIVSALATLCGTLFMQTLIDDYILPMVESGSQDFTPLAQALMKIVCVMVVGVCCAFAYNRIMVNVSQGTMKHLRSDLFTNMEKLPIRYFDTHTHGDTMSVYTNDVDTLRQMIGMSAPQLMNSAITLIANFISMVVLDIPLTIVSVVMAGIMLLITSKMSALSSRYFVEQQKDLGRVDGYIEEMMSGQKVVKVFCHEEKNIEDFTKLNQKLCESSNNANKIANITMPINANLGNISYVLCAAIGGVLALNGYTGLTIGTLVAFLNLNKGFTQPITQVSMQISSIVMATAGAGRVFDLIDEEPEQDAGYVELVKADKKEGELTDREERIGAWAWKHTHQADGSVTYQPVNGHIEFENVDFSYNADKQILFDINMFAEPGQKIALVGSTGAGKTTITNLINRFYDLQDGKVRFDGINIEKIKKPELRHSLGMVLQDTNLFTDTVMENIRYGRLDATDEECVRAAMLANADGFIRRLPNGYDTVLTGAGAGLSQGQRQLLSIARAAVMDPPVLILDEATSSIDTRTEKLVQQGMDELMQGRTTFVIAHRLSTIRNADCIMVMEMGRIIERGTHDDLMAQKGRYYQLYTGNAIAQ